MLFQISSSLYFTSSQTELAIQNEAPTLESPHFLEIVGSNSDEANVPLSDIYSFCETISSTLERKPSVPIVVCPASTSPSCLSTACMLCGAYLILHNQLALDAVITTFSCLESLTNNILERKVVDEPITTCWRAIERARSLRWLGSQPYGADLALDMEMACHYALASNGGVRVLVPGKLLLAPSPAPLPAGQEWADIRDPRGITERHFSVGFLGDLLVDLDVSAVAWLEYGDESDASELAARGLDVHDLGLDPRRPALLGAIDHLLEVSRAAPGAVAVFGGGGGDATVRTLAATWLVTEYGFDGEAAGAWLRMICG